ncbi:unnamed protein product, partial [Meganyctiphanes norvegica]
MLIEYDKSLLKSIDNNGNMPLHLSITTGNLSTKLVDFFLLNQANNRAVARKSQTPIHIASEKGNSDIVKLFIDQSVPLDEKDSEKFTALHLAAKNGHKNCCELLVKAGAEINAKSKREQTPLHLAAQMKYTACCSFLLESGADINTQDGDGNTAFHLVCSSMRSNKGTEGCVKCVTLLLEKNADPNILNKKNETALQAAKKAPVDVLKLFENIDVNITQTDLKGQTILHNVANRREIMVCELILNMCKRQEEDIITFVNQQDNDNFTALHCAIQSKNTESCKVLIQAGADGNICNSYGNALHMAAEFGHEDICDFLITKGIQNSMVNKNNKTALQIAAHKGYKKICKSILNRNPDVMLTDSDGNTALHLAAMEGNIQCCRLLADKNQHSVNKVNKEGKTPLHLAAISGKFDSCKVLTEKRSETWKKDNEGHSAVWYSHSQMHDEIFILLVNSSNISLIEKDVDLSDILKSAIKDNRSVVCEGLLQCGNWEEGFKSPSISENENFRSIIMKYPDLAKYILDKCQIKASEEKEERTTYNFTYLDETTPK